MQPERFIEEKRKVGETFPYLIVLKGFNPKYFLPSERGVEREGCSSHPGSGLLYSPNPPGGSQPGAAGRGRAGAEQSRLGGRSPGASPAGPGRAVPSRGAARRPRPGAGAGPPAPEKARSAPHQTPAMRRRTGTAVRAPGSAERRGGWGEPRFWWGVQPGWGCELTARGREVGGASREPPNERAGGRGGRAIMPLMPGGGARQYRAPGAGLPGAPLPRCSPTMMSMNSKQAFSMHPILHEPKYPHLHSSSEAIRRACLPAPQVSRSSATLPAVPLGGSPHPRTAPSSPRLRFPTVSVWFGDALGVWAIPSFL